jgi:exosortase/archaeosortase family protein
MVKEVREFRNIFVRYLLIVLFGLGNLWLIYRLMKPLTIYGSGYLLSLFYDVSILGSVLLIEGLKFEVVNACVAGSAYYLLMILALSTKAGSWGRHIKLILIGWGMLLGFNVIRIIILIVMGIGGSIYFDVIHKVFWYGLSTIFVLIAWFFSAYILKIKAIPVYSDFKYIIGKIRVSSKKKHKKGRRVKRK